MRAMTRNRFVMILGLCIAPIVVVAGEQGTFEDQKEKVGYSIGYQVGGDVRRQGLSVNPDMVIRGVLDALAGAEPLLTDDEMRRALVELQKEADAAGRRQQDELARKNLAAGVAFLVENGQRQEIQTLPSGLQYRILAAGSGRTPRAIDVVTVHHRGTTIDGSEFESSLGRGEPAAFRVDAAVIAGWTEALQMMKEGSRWELFVPPELGYGVTGTDRVEPNSTLIFEIELISVTTSE